MSLSKRCFFPVLFLVVAFAMAPGSHVQAQEVDVLTPYRNHPAVARDEPRFLPVQSQNPDDLGAGKLLVARRDMHDPNFAETVILLVRCDAAGVVGLVLNQRTTIPLSRVLEQFDAAKGRSDPVYAGGPVDTPAVLALLRSTAKLDGAEPVLSDVYLISSKTAFEKAISGRPDPGNLHVYLGYAGWTQDQLRLEVKLGAWFIFPGDARTVFDSEPDSLWRQMIQKTELQMVWSDPLRLEPYDAGRKLWVKSPRFRTRPLQQESNSQLLSAIP